MGWRIFAGLNSLMWVRGSWRMVSAGAFPGAFELIGIAMSGVAAFGLFLYAHKLFLGSNRFWSAFLQLFIIWTFLSLGVMVVGRPWPLGATGLAAAILAVGLLLVYSYFQGLALYRQGQSERY